MSCTFSHISVSGFNSSCFCKCYFHRSPHHSTAADVWQLLPSRTSQDAVLHISSASESRVQLQTYIHRVPADAFSSGLTHACHVVVGGLMGSVPNVALDHALLQWTSCPSRLLMSAPHVSCSRALQRSTTPQPLRHQSVASDEDLGPEGLKHCI